MMPKLPLALLLASTALVPAAYAQNTNSDIAAIEDGAICAEFVAYVDENDGPDITITPERAEAIAANGDPQTCRDSYRLAAGEISADETAENFDADAMARIRVAVPEPEVTVSQAAPQVSVEQPQPQVNVTPGRPIVTVNQAEPVVRVNVTPPTITIDMPKPEILVELPDPTVDVAMAQPRVTVNQAQPTVNVEQGEVKLQIGESDVAASDTNPQVTVEKASPTVSVNEAEGANISIEEVTADVRYNAAEPRIEMAEAGQPKITFNQSGEANVRFRQMSEDETRTAALADIDAPEMADADADKPEMAKDDVEKPAMTTASAEPKVDPAANKNAFLVEQLLDKSVIGADGDTIGDVENVVTRGDATYLVIGTGGFLGIAERQIALPIEDVKMVEEDLVTNTVTREAVSEMTEMAPEEYRPLGTEQDVEIVIQ
ncbi:MAG: PRC-barrel domain-containing protein [Devosia sp.]